MRTTERPWLAKLTKAQAVLIATDPRPRKELAEVFNVSVNTIGDIKIGRAWGHATGITYKPLGRRGPPKKDEVCFILPE